MAGKRVQRVVQVVRAAPRRAAQHFRQQAPIVIRQAGHVAKRGGKAVASAALEEKHTMVAMMAAAALGYLQKSGTSLPTIPGLGKAGTLGIGTFVAGKVTKNRMIRHAATGLLCIAVNEFVRTGAVSGDVMGVASEWD